MTLRISVGWLAVYYSIKMLTEQDLRASNFTIRFQFCGLSLRVFKLWTNILDVERKKFIIHNGREPTENELNNGVIEIHRNLPILDWDKETLDELVYYADPTDER